MLALEPGGGAVEVAGLVLRTPGLSGVAEQVQTNPGAMRGESLVTDEFDQALASEGLEPQHAVILRDTREILGVQAAESRSTSTGEAAIQVDAPAPADGWGQVLLSTDEAGVMTWNFAESENPTGVASRGGNGVRTYLVRRHVPPAPAFEAGTSRGLAGVVGEKLLKVLAFKLIDKVAGEVGDHFVARWEEKKRPYRVREFSPENYKSAEPPLVEGERWGQLGAGRALIFVHGTFSRAHTCFGLLPLTFLEQMRQRYGGRVFAFDHYTLSQDPYANVDWLIQRIPEGTKLELDIVCHSRGGLVSRVLAERQSEISLGSRSVDVRRVAFVASPNNGTLLGDPEHFGDLIDTYTSLVNLFPDTGMLEVIQAVISVVKQIAVGALGGLDGLVSMAPGGDFLKALNTATPAKADYFALASDYEPVSAGLRDFVADRLADLVFKAENDLIVPTAGVYEENGSSQFPIQRLHSFPAADGVEHTRYFCNETTQTKLSEWLATEP
ncbi:MAG TPA: hypothetical protein VJ204_03390 [Solirubrobacterales bacterium]|nr:hypothetical protein [Solirubrobacterales bacterium]